MTDITDTAPIDPQGGAAGRAAGILFAIADGTFLLMQRGNGGDYPLHWAFPGGHQEGDETIEQTARREALEETGLNYEGPLTFVHDDGQFVTFRAELPETFPVTLCDESNGYVWATADTLPQPMHPGCVAALRVAAIRTELDAAELVRDGVLPSPFPYANMLLLDLRITGTGTATRIKLTKDGTAVENREHVYRDPALYLNDEFLRRCNGLPVILDHPADATLDSQEFADRISGTVMLPYLRDDEVRGVCRIYAADAIQEIIEAMKPGAEGISTSPTVVLSDLSESTSLKLESGENLLFEGKPILLDHIAIVSKSRGGRGVWDKGGPPSGINLGVIDMAEEKKADEVQKVDDSANLLKSIADNMAALSKRMDSYEEARKADSVKADEAKAKADAEKAEEDKKADAEIAAKKADEDAKRADAEEKAKADAQAKADSVYAMHGDKAPRALSGESSMAYRRRLAGAMKVHSAMFKSVDLAGFADEAALSIAEKQIYADAMTAARNPTNIGEGELREVVSHDISGRRISTFIGEPNAWMQQFKIAPRRASFARNGSN